MPETLRVSLAPTQRQTAAMATPGLLLDAAGPVRVLGATEAGDALAAPVTPTPATMFGPRGGVLCGADGPLWMADTGHHRLLGWRQLPTSDNAPADWLIGQPDFTREGRNAKGDVTAHSLNVPTGITPCGKGLAVADAWNHRVLIWHETPQNSHTPADVALGQAGFTGGEGNRGQAAPTASTLFWPYGVYWDGARLWVSDTGNRRVLMWEGLPQRNGQPADLVLGQADFVSRDENGGGAPDARSMRWPHALTLWRGRLCVADAGNNRVMVWNGLPQVTNQRCDIVLGQSDFRRVDHNQGRYWPDAASLNMPYGASAAGDWLIVADTASSRLLAWHTDDCRTGAEAKLLAGQYDFQAKGDNRWQAAVRDSICWPYAVQVCGDTVLISDSGNNRALLWRLAGSAGVSPAMSA